MSTHRPFRAAGRTALALVLASGLALSACGDDEDDASTADTTTESTEEGSETTDGGSESTAPAGDTVEIELVDYGFEGVPESVPAGTKITVTNSSEAEFHELVAFRLPDDETRSSEELVNLPEEEIQALFTGEPATVLLAGPHGAEQTAAVGDGTLTEPGRYLLLCSIPTGADPAEFEQAAEEGGPPPEDPDAGPPHFVEGMHAELIVE